MRPILPSLREKNRYIVYNIKSEKKLKFHEIMEAVENAHLRFLGELETAKAGVRVMDHFYQNQGIVKVHSKYVDKSRVAMMLLKKVQGKEVNVQTVGVSGTLKRAKSKFFNQGGGL